jgi:hypothetical protein
MSRETALKNIRLESCDRWAHTEYSLEYHKEYISRLTGKDPESTAALRGFYDSWQLDMLWCTDDGIRGDWQAIGRATDMGHAEYAEKGSDRREPKKCPFRSAEEVWAFDAVEEYGLPHFDAQVAEYESLLRARRQKYPNQLTTGGYYKTIVSGAIQSFGWEMFLEAAADPAKMEPVFHSFFRRSLFHMRAWAETSAPVVIQHDDFVWSAGAFMHPDIYRRAIIPLYAELWKPIHAAGKKVLFCSDGNFMEFAEDIVEAGADGLIFEPCNDFGVLAQKFGSFHCLVGSFVDCRDMTLGKWDKVKQDLDKTFEALSLCRGAVLAVGNHIPANVPVEMLENYLGYLKANLSR